MKKKLGVTLTENMKIIENIKMTENIKITENIKMTEDIKIKESRLNVNIDRIRNIDLRINWLNKDVGRKIDWLKALKWE